MQITMVATDTFLTIEGCPTRLWLGTDGTGVPCLVAVRAIMVDRAHPQDGFELWLQEMAEPTPDMIQTGDSCPVCGHRPHATINGGRDRHRRRGDHG